MTPDRLASTPQRVLYWARRTPDAVALIDDQASYSYRDLAIGIARYAQALDATGVRPGMLVGLEHRVRYLHLILILACELIGATSVSLAPDEIEADDELMARCGFLCVGTAPGDAGRHAGLLHLTQTTIDSVARLPLMGAGLDRLDTRPAHDRVLRLVRTSGSTGRPKVMAMTTAATQRLLERTMMPNGRPEYDWNFINVYNFALRSAQIESEIALRAGKTVVSSHFETVFADLARFPQCHLTLLSGDAARLVAACPANWSGPRACMLNVKGGPLAAGVRRYLLDHIVMDLVHSYAASETYRLTEIDETGAGTLCAGVSIRIADHHGQGLPLGEIGLIEARSPTMVDGYLWDPAATRAAFVNGWYRTNDIGSMLSPDRLVVLGRVDDMLNIGGVKFAPHGLEEQIRGLDGIMDAVLVAVPDQDGVDQLKVVVEPGGGTLQPAVRDRINELVATRARLFAVHTMRALPRTSTGKVHRGDLRKLLMVS